MHYEYEILNYTFVPIQVYDSVFVSLLFISAVCILVFLSSSSIMTLLLRKTHKITPTIRELARQFPSP